MSANPRCQVAILVNRASTSRACILGTSAIDYQLTLCHRHGFERILLVVRDEDAVIRERYEGSTRFDLAIDCLVVPTVRGSAGAIADGRSLLDDDVLALDGNTFLDVDLRRMWDAHLARHAEVTVLAQPNDHPAASDLLILDDTGAVTAIHHHPHTSVSDCGNLAIAGLFGLNRAAVEKAVPPSGPFDVARQLLPALLDRGGRVVAYRTPEYARDCSTPESLRRVEEDLSRGVPERLSGRHLRQAVFLDRDGTLNREVNYLNRPDQLELLDGAAAAVGRLNRMGVLSVVVTNQSAVARGHLTLAGLGRIHRRLEDLLAGEGAYVDAIHACPHHPDRGPVAGVPELTIECECRKPATGLVDAACRELLIDRRFSWFVGDKTSDIETGRRAGLRTILVRTGYAGSDGAFQGKPDFTADNVSAAIDWILSCAQSPQRHGP